MTTIAVDTDLSQGQINMIKAFLKKELGEKVKIKLLKEKISKEIPEVDEPGLVRLMEQSKGDGLASREDVFAALDRIIAKK